MILSVFVYAPQSAFLCPFLVFDIKWSMDLTLLMENETAASVLIWNLYVSVNGARIKPVKIAEKLSLLIAS